MTSKLRSHLRNSDHRAGFTLIELLVVIAIIAILVVIVVFAINPVARLRDANDRRASSDVRSIGTGIQACITDQLGKGTDPAIIYSSTWGAAAAAQDAAGTTWVDRSCGARADLIADGYVTNPPVTLSATATDIVLNTGANPSTRFCIWSRAGNGQTHNHWAFYATDQVTWTLSGTNVITDKDAHTAPAGGNVLQGGKSEIYDVGASGGVQAGNPTGCTA